MDAWRSRPEPLCKVCRHDVVHSGADCGRRQAAACLRAVAKSLITGKKSILRSIPVKFVTEKPNYSLVGTSRGTPIKSAHPEPFGCAQTGLWNTFYTTNQQLIQNTSEQREIHQRCLSPDRTPNSWCEHVIGALNKNICATSKGRICPTGGYCALAGPASLQLCWQRALKTLALKTGAVHGDWIAEASGQCITTGWQGDEDDDMER